MTEEKHPTRQRGEWTIDIVEDLSAEYAWMQRGPHFSTQTARLDSIFYVREIPYEWHTLEKVRLTK